MSETVFWHAQSAQVVLKAVQKRRVRREPNELPRERPDGGGLIFVRQFLSPLIFILIAAAGVSVWLGDLIDAGIIIAAVVLNTVIGFVQELKANRALVKLQSYIQPVALVRRDGREIEISAREVTVGDVLVLQTGAQMSADARLLEAHELQANESPLTGESLPVSKQTQPLANGTILAERTNMIYAGTTIVGGRGTAVVVAIGAKTEIGRIAKLISTTSEAETPLQKQLGQLAKWIGVIVVGLVAVLFVLGIVTGRGMIQMFEMSVALSVAAIPEGLTVSVTIILAIGMQRILKRRSLVRKLIAAETLGSVSVICSDKTGTITEGNMRVVSVITAEQVIDAFALRGKTHRGAMQHLLECLVICNDAKLVDGKEEHVIRGSATERALLVFATDVGMDPDVLHKQYPLIADIPFDSARKYRLTEHRIDESIKLAMVGAPAKVLAASRLTSHELSEWQSQEQKLAKQGLRLVGIAHKSINKTISTLAENDLNGFTFLGMVALQDPLRSDVPAQITAARRAGIRTVIVTGDHPWTAQTIARQAGIVVADGSVVLGAELDKWSDEELQRRVSRVSVFARVEPRHKIRIVAAWQKRGEVVAMTGDGVNDAPALKAADIGIALGSGTDVAKQASDLVLLDNNFSTITAAIEEGRVIFDNIRKSSAYLMADSFTEIILIAGSILMGLPVPILPAQILWVNLVADSFPNVGLTLEPGEKDVMKLSPRPRSEPVLNREMTTIIFTIGIVTDLLLFGLYFWLLQTIQDIGVIRSIMFAAVGIDSLIYIFAVKSFRQTIFRMNPFSNLWLVGGVAIGFGLMLLALIHPFFQTIFEVSPLGLSDWLLLLMIGILKLVAIETVKEWFIFKRRLI